MFILREVLYFVLWSNLLFSNLLAAQCGLLRVGDSIIKVRLKLNVPLYVCDCLIVFWSLGIKSCDVTALWDIILIALQLHVHVVVVFFGPIHFTNSNEFSGKCIIIF